MKKRFAIHHLFMFLMAVMLSSVVQVAAQAEFRPRLFAEVYDETINMGKLEDNTITMAQALEGVRFGLFGISTMDLYFKQRIGSDANRDFWNNRAELMVGTRLRFFQRIYLALCTELVNGHYMKADESTLPDGADYTDVRAGLIFWQGFDGEAVHRWNTTVPLTLWDEIYGDFFYFRNDRRNGILYVNGKVGFRLLRLYKTAIDAYWVSYLMTDINGDYWNNKTEAGLGIRVKPWNDLDFDLFVEFLNGKVTPRSGDYENPNDSEYRYTRIGLTFWHGWGS